MKARSALIIAGVAWLGLIDPAAATEKTVGFIPTGAGAFDAWHLIDFPKGEFPESRLLAQGPMIRALSGGTSAAASGHWRAVASGNGLLVAIDCHGKIQSSVDGANWTLRDAGIPFALRSVAFGNSRFVVVGNEGALVTSEDGVHWTRRDAGTDERLRAVLWADGVFVAVGYAGTILTSKSGSRWTRRDSGTGERLQAIGWGHGTFVAVGWNGVIVTSTHGVRWSNQRCCTKVHLHHVTWTNDLFLALGEAGTRLVSTNGTNWSLQNKQNNQTRSLNHEKHRNENLTNNTKSFAVPTPAASQMTYIQRVNTTGGRAPATPPSPSDVEVRVPYTAEYYFYRKIR